MASVEAEDSKEPAMEPMEDDKDSDKSSDNEDPPQGESSGDTSSTDDEAENAVNILENKVSQNVYDYSAHVELITSLRKMGELTRLRAARSRMLEHFPLSPELWLGWLQDEQKLAETDEEKAAVTELFEKAVKDYLSVDIWLEFAQFTIGCMGQKDGVDNVRAVFERALTAAGLHVTKGVVLWEAYREFENVMTAMLEEKADASPEDKERFESQKKRALSVFRRQLSVPLMDKERTLVEYKEWLPSIKEEEDKNVELNYKKALDKLNKIMPFELQLMSTPDSKKEVYLQYLQYEKTDGDPARVQCLYERAIEQLCLDGELWLDYIQYLDTQLKIGTVVLPVCERAVRNCPWSSPIWQYYLRVLERYETPHDKVKAVMEQALTMGFSSAEDYRTLWQTYLDYLRRIIKWDNKDINEDPLAKELRATYNRACEHLAQYFGLNGDPTCSILQSWARVEAIHFRDMEATRKLWNDIFSQGHDKVATMWLEYISLEKCYGDTKHLRRLFQRALASVQDWPESIGEAWLNFERDEGTLESFEACEAKYKARLKFVQDLRKKQAAKEAEAVGREERRRQLQHHQDPRNQGGGKKRDTAKRKLEDGGKWASVAAESVVIPPGQPLPPKVEPAAIAKEEPPQKKAKPEEKSEGPHGVTVPHDPAKDNRTVFVSNLDYSLEESTLREQFAGVGTITDLRMVKDFKGRFKGFGYVEFSSPAEAAEALKKDHHPINGRPMYVSKCDPDKQTRKPGFKYSTDLEKSKLFIRVSNYTSLMMSRDCDRNAPLYKQTLLDWITPRITSDNDEGGARGTVQAIRQVERCPHRHVSKRTFEGIGVR
ncbi:squamous cell carcinoma antigen recognized by T-cells 3 isoform X2 [Anabrus simplex]|uniref:squamous cell carcinoma antigen recognized by T-cells 3 isoform X2 n=1 Tax=Anabrus simplex TaxID=316456 RepID=UPI0035A3BB45